MLGIVGGIVCPGKSREAIKLKKLIIVSLVISMMLVMMPQSAQAAAVKDSRSPVPGGSDCCYASEDPAATPVISIEDAEVVLSESVYTYDGENHLPAIETIGGMRLAPGIDYKATFIKTSIDAGTYTIYITGIGSYEGTTTADYEIKKAGNSLSVKGRTAEISYSKLKKSSRTLKVSKVIKFHNKGQGKKTFKLSSAKKGNKSFRKYFRINSKTGSVTVKKGLKKGTYTVKVNVRAAGNSNYKAGTKTAAFRLKVIPASYYINTGDCYTILNKYRKNAGRKALKRTSKLERFAKIRAKELVKLYSHTRPDGSSGMMIIPGYGYKGENIAWGHVTCAKVSKAWYNSPAHRKNMLMRQFTKVGIAGYKYKGDIYWVQLFSS